MATNNNNDSKKNLSVESIFKMWGRRNPYFEKQYEFGDKDRPGIIRVLTDYGLAANKYSEDKGKVLGPGYESYIMAFFIGLYSGRKLSLSPNANDKKNFGWSLENWNGVDRKGRKKYEDLRHYMFVALVAKTDIDWLALDEGTIDPESVVSKLIDTMEEYANYGYYVMTDKYKEDKAYFFSNRSFLDIFLELTHPVKKAANNTTADPI